MIDTVSKMVLLALIGSMIGWITNILALKLIFRPLNAIRIPILGIKFQGVIPKRKAEIATSIGQTVEKELIKAEDILGTLISDEKIEHSLSTLKIKIREIIDDRMSKYIILSNFKSSIIKYVDNIIDSEGKEYIKDIINNISSQAAEEVQIAKIIEDRINSFELEKIEEIILKITKKELRYIEIIGALLGLFIGIIQGLIVIVL